MSKTVFLLFVTFPDPEAGNDASFEMVVSSHGSMDSATKAAELYGSPYMIKEVGHYE